MSTEKRPLQVFISYASQDKLPVLEIYGALKLEGWIDPWLDKEKILPGQDWQMAIETAVDEADVAIVCFSNQSVSKEGYVQREIRYAYDIALEKPEGTIFLIPLRLDECEIPRKLRFLQRVDFFGIEKDNAYSDLLDALKIRYDQKLKIEEDRARREKERLESASVESLAGEKADQATQEKAKQGTVVKAKPDEKERAPKLDNISKVEGRIPNKRNPKKGISRLDPAIIAALIGLLGTIIVTLYANRPATPPIPTPTTSVAFTTTVTDTPVSTEAVTPEGPTFTPVPATDTPPPTFTIIPAVALGQDWTAGCISTLWKPYPLSIPVTEKGDGCWKEPVHVFYAENGDLDVLAEGRNEETEIYGLFAPLPEKGTITITVRLSELTNVDIWLGVFAEQEVDSQGLLMTIPEGSAKERVVVQKNPLNGVTITGTSLLDQGKGFSISFTFTANSARSTVNPSVFVTDSVSIPSSQKWLFLGYKSLIGYYRIEGRFLGFELE